MKKFLHWLCKPYHNMIDMMNVAAFTVAIQNSYYVTAIALIVLTPFLSVLMEKKYGRS